MTAATVHDCKAGVQAVNASAATEETDQQSLSSVSLAGSASMPCQQLQSCMCVKSALHTAYSVQHTHCNWLHCHCSPRRHIEQGRPYTKSCGSPLNVSMMQLISQTPVQCRRLGSIRTAFTHIVIAAYPTRHYWSACLN